MSGLLRQLNRLTIVAILGLELCLIAAQTGVVGWDPASFTLPLGIVVAIKMVITLAGWRSADEVSDETFADSRSHLIEIMSRDWIMGYLDAALAEDRFHFTVDARVNKPGMRPYSLPSSLLKSTQSLGRSPATQPYPPAKDIVLGVFRDVKRKLALVGEPGGGKTILLLQLANALLKDARADDHNGVPLMYDLSSWKEDSTTLDEWLTAEMAQHYGFSAELARAWVHSEGLIYLLDGLDEVRAEWRSACVEAINNFMNKRRQVIVSCRLEEFAAIADKLDIKTVVEILPLAQEHVQEVLERDLEIDKVSAILQEARRSEAIWRAVSKPLVVSSIAKAYDSEGFAFRGTGDDSSRSVIRRMVIEPLVHNQLRELAGDEASAARYRSYLCWLAHCMRLRNQNRFYLETMQGDWLPVKAGGVRWFSHFVRRLPIKLDSRFDFSLEQIVRGLASGLSFFLFLALPLALIVMETELFTILTRQDVLFADTVSLLERHNVRPEEAANAFDALVNGSKLWMYSVTFLIMVGTIAIWNVKVMVQLRKRRALGEGIRHMLRFAIVAGLYTFSVVLTVILGAGVFVIQLHDEYIRQAWLLSGRTQQPLNLQSCLRFCRYSAWL